MPEPEQNGPGRTLPAGGSAGQVPVVTPDTETNIEWGDSSDVAFTPADASKWHTGNVPTNIAQALNAIAASVTITH